MAGRVPVARNCDEPHLRRPETVKNVSIVQARVVASGPMSVLEDDEPARRPMSLSINSRRIRQSEA